MRDENPDIVKRLLSLRVWKRSKDSAIHKPLLLLMYFAHVQRHQTRLWSFCEIDSPLSRLLQEFASEGRHFHTHHPFWRLQNDGIWEVRAHRQLAVNSSGDVSHADLMKYNARAGLIRPLYEQLIADRALIRECSQVLLDGHFDPALHTQICARAGLQLD